MFNTLISSRMLSVYAAIVGFAFVVASQFVMTVGSTFQLISVMGGAVVMLLAFSYAMKRRE